MESGALHVEVGSGSPPAQPGNEDDPRFAAAKAAGRGEEGREMVEHAAMGAKLDDAEEASALDWLLGDPVAIEHDVPVQYETPNGLVPLTFVIRQIDARKIDEIEQSHVNRTSGVVDRYSAECQIVAEATRVITDRSGKQVDPASETFRTVKVLNRQTGQREEVVLASSMMALERRFGKQLGLLGGVAAEVRKAAGFDVERVGAAQRRLVEASLG